VAVARQHARETLALLAAAYPEAHCALVHTGPWQLLVATILSAQCTDVRVNQVTPVLFARWPDVAAMAAADPEEVAATIRSVGFFRTKAANLVGAAHIIEQRHGGQVPATLEQLVRLPGVGRKTANVVLGNAFGRPAMVVDTHVKRIAFRLGWTRQTDPEAIEVDLCRLLPRSRWTLAGHLLIQLGRTRCKAPVPECSACPVADRCPRCGVGRSK